MSNIVNRLFSPFSSPFSIEKRSSTSFLLDSERSNECIDFTMMCAFFFFLCLSSRFGSRQEIP
ncbi:hypothetical protein FWK35_00016204 [Aphis craccivora]|uniref:Uncharacterized protein n=1 Tax=Aphis craccivora TaxID=307492 RepID=A0A6G0WQG5_APHCR|nr:hypothetical protein FWK35_00016204 [Aphis craccivora]